jgi:hypothetical protein
LHYLLQEEANMRKLLPLWVLLIGIGLATPALAGHRGHSRGQRIVRSGYHSRPVYYRPRLAYDADFFFSVGRPTFRVGLYAPAPIYYFGPPSVQFDRGWYRPVWVPGHYIRDRGARIWIEGYWIR